MQSYEHTKPKDVLAFLSAFIIDSELYLANQEEARRLSSQPLDNPTARYLQQEHDNVLFYSRQTINDTLAQLHQSGHGLAYVGPSSPRPIRIIGVRDLEFSDGCAAWELENFARPVAFQSRFIRSYPESD